MLFSLEHFSFCHVTVLWLKKLGFFFRLIGGVRAISPTRQE